MRKEDQNQKKFLGQKKQPSRLNRRRQHNSGLFPFDFYITVYDAAITRIESTENVEECLGISRNLSLEEYYDLMPAFDKNSVKFIDKGIVNFIKNHPDEEIHQLAKFSILMDHMMKEKGKIRRRIILDVEEDKSLKILNINYIKDEKESKEQSNSIVIKVFDNQKKRIASLESLIRDRVDDLIRYSASKLFTKRQIQILKLALAREQVEKLIGTKLHDEITAAILGVKTSTVSKHNVNIASKTKNNLPLTDTTPLPVAHFLREYGAIKMSEKEMEGLINEIMNHL